MLRDWSSRRRYELLGVGVAVAFAALHWGLDGRESGGRSGPLSVAARTLSALEGRASDLHVRARGIRPPHPDVLVVAIDETAVQRHGRWPWSRALMARALERLHALGPAAVGLDVTFVDEDGSPSDAGLATLAEALDREIAGFAEPSRARLAPVLAALRRRESGDEALARVLSSAPELVQGLSAYGREEARDYVEQLADAEAVLAPRVLTRFPAPSGRSEYEVRLGAGIADRFVSAQVPLRRFVDRGQRLAHFNVVRDDDGVLRRTPPFVQLEHPAGLLPSLELQTAAVALGASIEPVWDPDVGRLAGARLRRDGRILRVVPVALGAPQTRIDYPGPGASFPTVSLGDVLDGRVPEAAVRGKVALLGVTLVGQYDQVVTPFRPVEAGVFVHAAMLSNVLSGRFLQRGTGSLLAELAFLLGAGLLLGLALPRAAPWMRAALPLALGVGWLVGVQAALRNGVVLASALPLANVFVGAFAIVFVGYLSTDREKAKLRRTFRYYVGDSVMTEMLEHPELLRLGGEKRDCTVLFSDIRGFTAISEAMEPERLVRLINDYLSPMTRIVFEEGGTLDKYIGDALMAFWGAPIPQEDHALRACRAALRFLDALEALRPRWTAEGLPDIRIGVGINSGPMVVGNMGSDVRFDYTVMGDAVNLASRLEGANKLFHTQVLVSEETWRRVESHVSGRRLASLKVRGRMEPVRVWELRAARPPTSEERALDATFEAAVDAVAARRLDEAEAGLRAVLAVTPYDAAAQQLLAEVGSLRSPAGRPGRS